MRPDGAQIVLDAVVVEQRVVDVEQEDDVVHGLTLSRRRRVAPRSVGADQRVGRLRPPGSGLVLVTGRRIVEDRLDDPPLRVDDVLPAEQFAVAAHRVAEQALIGRRQRGSLLGQGQFDDLADHLFAGPLDPQSHRDADVRTKPHAHMAVPAPVSRTRRAAGRWNSTRTSAAVNGRRLPARI